MVDQYEVVSAGPDWITCSGKWTSRAKQLQDLGMSILQESQKAGESVAPAFRRDYHGLATNELFVGSRHDGVLVVASGRGCVPHAQQLIANSDNQSRLDLQVTVATGAASPYLAHETFARLKAYHCQHHTRRALTIIASHPHGATVMLGKRASGNYGRLYDKAVESSCGPPRSLWRYECEFKADPAKIVAAHLKDQDDPPAWVSGCVHSWWLERGAEPSFKPATAGEIRQWSLPHDRADHLQWFRAIVSHCVARSITKHGLQPTIEALGLDQLVYSVPRTEHQYHGEHLSS